jgi:hypothetical protein
MGGLLVVVGVGCATPTSSTMETSPIVSVEVPNVPTFPRPANRVAARHMLEGAFDAVTRDDHPLAAGLFRAVLATDFLTDKGRTNIYWMAAESSRRIHDTRGRSDALGGFLIASELVDEDDDLVLRRLIARSVLAAIRVAEDPGFGRSPELAISVEDAREPASIMASLSCGPGGEGRYVDVAIRSVERPPSEAERRVVRRTAQCQQTGRTLDLFFDVTHAQLRR